MATVVTIDSITGPDAQPTVAPHRISDKPGKDSLDIQFTPTSAASDIRKYVTRLAPSDRNTGPILARLGAVCGSGDRCGEARVMPLALPSGTPVSATVDYADTGPAADGVYNVDTFAWAEGEASG
jgi:hypothetical protein